MTGGTPPPVDLAGLIDNTRVSFRQGLVLLLCAVAMMIDGFDLQAIAFAGPEIAREWQISAAALGPVFSSGLFGGLLAAFILGPLSDRIGPKRMLLCSLVAMGTTTLLTALATNLSQLLIIRFLAGIGLGAALAPILSFLSGLSPSRMRATVVIVGVCGQLAGAAAGGAVASQMIPAFGWESIFVMGGLMPLALVLPVAVYFPESLPYLLRQPDGHVRIAAALRSLGKTASLPSGASFVWPDLAPRVSPRGLLDEQRVRVVIFVMLAYFFATTFFYFSANWLPIILRGSGASAEQAILGGVVLNIGGVIGAIGASFLVRRVGVFLMVATGVCVAAMLMLILGATDYDPNLTFALIFAIGVFGLGALISHAVITLSVFPFNLHGTAVGIQTGFGRIGAVAGPLIGSLLLLAGLQPWQLFRFSAACAMLDALCIVGVWKFAPKIYGASGR